MLQEPGQTTTTSCNIHKCCVKNLTSLKFEATTPNTSQHVATRWPNMLNMLLPTVSWYVVLTCRNRLAGALSCNDNNDTDSNRSCEMKGLKISGQNGIRAHDKGKKNNSQFWILKGIRRIPTKIPRFGRVRQIPIREFPTKFLNWDLSHSPKFGIFVGIL